MTAALSRRRFLSTLAGGAAGVVAGRALAVLPAAPMPAMIPERMREHWLAADAWGRDFMEHFFALSPEHQSAVKAVLLARYGATA